MKKNIKNSFVGHEGPKAGLTKLVLICDFILYSCKIVYNTLLYIIFSMAENRF